MHVTHTEVASIRRPHVVIIGGGFGGLATAEGLADSAVEVTLIDHRNHHTFQPLLYQVATAGLHPQDIVRPLRSIMRRHPTVDVRLGKVVGVDWAARALLLDAGESVGFDYLVVAAGSVPADFGVPGVGEHAFPMKDLEQAVRLRDHLIRCFELASVDGSAIDRGALRFVVAGGGPTGIELADALVELVDALASDFPEVTTARAEILLVEQRDELLAGFHPNLQRAAARALRRRGVELRMATGIERVTASSVGFADGEDVATMTVLWSAGIRANPLVEALGVTQGRGGRVVVDDELRIVGHQDAFAIGDIAAGSGDDGGLLPQIAPVASQQGRHVANAIRRLVVGQPAGRFRYVDRGAMAMIGRRDAVADVGGFRLRGSLAWLGWLVLHVAKLRGLRNRASVLLHWAWTYTTRDRSIRALTAGARARSLPDDRNGFHPVIHAA